MCMLSIPQIAQWGGQGFGGSNKLLILTMSIVCLHFQPLLPLGEHIMINVNQKYTFRPGHRFLGKRWNQVTLLNEKVQPLSYGQFWSLIFIFLVIFSFHQVIWMRWGVKMVLTLLIMMYNDDETEYKVGDQILVVRIFPPMCEVGNLIWLKYIIPIQYFQ